jgi:uncharacterized protein (TIGR00725 family)
MEDDFRLVKPIIRNIAFFGDSDIGESNPVYKDAFATAKLLAENGYVIVNGGGPGVMNASTQGAVAGKGETISVTFYPKEATGFEGRYVGNVTNIEIKTTNYIDRMFKLMEHGDIFIIFKGGTGTISEFGTAWVLAKLYYGHHKPFILFGDFWYGVIDAIKKGMRLSHEELNVFEIVEKPEEVLEAIHRFEAKLRKHDHSKCKLCKGKECAFIK